MAYTQDKQLDMFAEDNMVADLNVNDAIALAHQSRAEYTAHFFAGLSKGVKEVFNLLVLKPVKAFDRHIRLTQEHMNLDQRVLNEMGSKQWENPALAKDVVRRKPAAKTAEIPNVKFFKLLTLMETEAQRKEDRNNDHPMAA